MLQQLNAKVLLPHLLLFLVLISGSLSNAYSRQGNCVISARESIAASNGKEMLEDLHFKTTTKRFVLGGRKMGFHSTFMILEKLKGHGPCERPRKIASAIRRKQISRSLLSKEKEVAGFVAFNADYKGPRHHPPKNN